MKSKAKGKPSSKFLKKTKGAKVSKRKNGKKIKKSLMSVSDKKHNVSELEEVLKQVNMIENSNPTKKTAKTKKKLKPFKILTKKTPKAALNFKKIRAMNNNGKKAKPVALPEVALKGNEMEAEDTVMKDQEQCHGTEVNGTENANKSNTGEESNGQQDPKAAETLSETEVSSRAHSKKKNKNKNSTRTFELFVGNLPDNVRVAQLQNHFKALRKDITSLRVLTGRRCAFITLKNMNSYKKALKYHNTLFKGDKLRIEYTTPGEKDNRDRMRFIRRKTKKLRKRTWKAKQKKVSDKKIAKGESKNK